ncbi:MAG: protein-methionine-sulfoxide reductase catalytic subunit MsrP [Steroidobacteraceae bacterium]
MPAYRFPLIPASEITPEEVFYNRRQALIALGAAAATMVTPGVASAAARRNAKYSVTDAPNTYEQITTYNNFYEFGTDKSDPAERAGSFRTKPWHVNVSGATRNGSIALDDLLAGIGEEERVYRFRCVEAWSMVIPWVGIPLASLLRKLDPGPKARYVAFETLFDPKQMPGQRAPILDWPYREGLRMDEAMHPLTMLATGVYGKPLPNQNGAPLRLVVPWKYGFKSIKSIVSIRFSETRPRTSWNDAAPSEYGFFANVNPQVDHPRWSQASERRIGAGFFAARQPTLMFNGYAELVADLYKGMNLQRNF